MEGKTLSDICCDIYNAVFRKSISNSVFTYKHFDNPYRLSTPLLIHKMGDDIVGFNGYLAAKFICESQELYAAQSCDVAVLPQYRGRGVYTSIMKKAREKFRHEGLDFLFGFANKNSYGPDLKFGWKHESDFCRFFLPVDWYALLYNKIGKIGARIVHALLKRPILFKTNKLAGKNFKATLQCFDRCPFTEEDFTIINSCGRIMIKRSREYFLWKLDNNPTKNFKYIIARKEGRICGYVIYHVEAGEINVVDWYCALDYDGSVIMANLVKQLLNEGAKINIFFVNMKSEEAQFMKRLGFWNSSNKILKRLSAPLMLYILDKSLETKLSAPGKWLMRYIDSDTIIS